MFVDAHQRQVTNTVCKAKVPSEFATVSNLTSAVDELILDLFAELCRSYVLLAIEREDDLNQLQLNQLVHNLDAVSFR